MRVAFMHVDTDWAPHTRALAEAMVRSAHAVIPGVEVIHMSGDSTPPIEGADTVFRRSVDPEKMMLSRLEHYKSLPAGDNLFVDTDVIFQKNPEVVFKDEFDVALTRRDGSMYVEKTNLYALMPYNSGVMFCRNPRFFADCYDHCLTLEEGRKHWFGDQLALKVVVESGKYLVKELDCHTWNYAPKSDGEDLSSKGIVHYKGRKRKHYAAALKVAA